MLLEEINILFEWHRRLISLLFDVGVGVILVRRALRVIMALVGTAVFVLLDHD